MHIFGDLLAQGLNGGEFDFSAQAAQEKNLDRGLSRELDGMKVQQVGLDGEGIGPERRTVANVRHGVKAFSVDDRARDVNTIGWDQLLITAQVDGGDGVLVSITASAAGRGGDGKNTP